MNLPSRSKLGQTNKKQTDKLHKTANCLDLDRVPYQKDGKNFSLDHHVSPSYAKVAKDQLPPSIKIGADTPPRPLLSSEFPSVRRGRKTNSYGEYLKQMSQENVSFFFKLKFLKKIFDFFFFIFQLFIPLVCIFQEPKSSEDTPPQDENVQPHKNEPTTSKLQEISEVVSENGKNCIKFTKINYRN